MALTTQKQNKLMIIKELIIGSRWAPAKNKIRLLPSLTYIALPQVFDVSLLLCISQPQAEK